MEGRIIELLTKVSSFEKMFNLEDLHLLENELERQYEEETKRKIPRKIHMYRIYGLIDLIIALKTTKLNESLQD